MSTQSNAATNGDRARATASAHIQRLPVRVFTPQTWQPFLLLCPAGSTPPSDLPVPLAGIRILGDSLRFAFVSWRPEVGTCGSATIDLVGNPTIKVPCSKVGESPWHYVILLP
jgi:hypothetical protein